MNKALLFLSVSYSIFWVACGTPKPITKTTPKDETLGEIQGTIVFNPKTGRYDTIGVRNTKIDTITWQSPNTKTTPPIKSDMKNTGVKTNPNAPNSTTSTTTKPNTTNSTTSPATNPSDYGKNNMPLFVKAPAGTKMKSAYNVALALPFFTDKYSDLDKELYEKSIWALHFYAGAKMALDTLSQEGINLKVSVLDTRASETHMPLVLADESMQNADLIIGAETAANVKMTADFAKLNKKVFISPYNPSADVVSDNQQLVQINPSLRTHCEAMMRHIRKTYRPEQIVIVSRDKTSEKEAVQYLQTENIRLSNGLYNPLKELVIDEKAGLIATDIKGAMSQEQMVYIVPIWGQNSETLIYSLLNKINNSKGKRNVVVYGMPQWANFQVNGYDAFEPLKVHITQPTYVDKLNTYARNFSVNYFKTYNAAPNDEAYLGYDIMLYAGRMLHRYGTKFNEVLDQVPFSGLETKFNFQRERNLTNTNSENPSAFDRFANKYVNILKFENGCFNVVD
jgi:hypothetical protein